MALTAGLLDQYWRRYNQRRALTGLPSSYQEMRGTLDPMLEYSAKEKYDEARLRSDNQFRERQMSLQEKAQKDAARAATISGVAQTGGLLGSAYLMNKSINASSASNARLLDLMAGKSAPGMLSPTSAGVGSAGVLPPVGVGSGTPVAGAAYPGIGGATGVAGQVGPVSAVGESLAAPAAAAPGAGGSLLGAVGPAAGLFAAQYATGKMAQPYLDKAGFPNAGKGWTYAGLPGAFIGGSIDIGKKAFDEVGDFASDIFGW